MEEPRFSSFFFRQRLNAVGIPFLAGTLFFLIAPRSQGVVWILLFAILFLGMTFLHKEAEGRITLLCVTAGLALCLVLSGITLFQSFRVREISGKEIGVKGTVTAVSKESFDLSFCSLEGKGFFWSIRCQGGETPAVGDRLSGRFVVSGEASSSELGEGIDLVGTFFQTPEKIGKSFLFSSADSIRGTLIKRFGTSREAGFLRAALLGDRLALSTRDQNAFSSTGSSHLLAISGLHLTQMVGFFICAFRFLPISRRNRQRLLFPLILFLYLLTGASVSVFRAGFMLCFSLSASLFRRRLDSVTSLTLAACLLTLSCPYVLLNPSFLFSFFSTFAILAAGVPLCDALHRTICSYFRKDRGFLLSLFSYITSALILSSCISVFTFPLQLLFFGEIQLLSPLYSVFLIALFSPCLFLGLLYALVLLLPFTVPFVETVWFFCTRAFLSLVSLLANSAPNFVSLSGVALPLAMLWFSLLLGTMILRMPIRILLYFHLSLLAILGLFALL